MYEIFAVLATRPVRSQPTTSARAEAVAVAARMASRRRHLRRRRWLRLRAALFGRRVRDRHTVRPRAAAPQPG